MLTFDDLTEGQKTAYTRVLARISENQADQKSSNITKHITIRGSAGTGKTTLTKFLLNELFSRGVNGVVLCAPTHQAKKELAKASGRHAFTLHSVFKVNPITLEENQIFEQREIPDLSSLRVLIVDEASMNGRKMFDIVMNSIPSWCTVVAIGDYAQLRPVEINEAQSERSPFFTDPRFEQIELTQVKRYDGPLIKVATDIRNGKWIYHCVENGHGVHQQPDFRSMMINYFSQVKTIDDLRNNRLMAYTNKTVDKLNEIVRKYLFKTTVPFIKDEILVMQEPLMVEHSLGGKTLQEIVLNNGQYVKVLNAQERTTSIKARGMEPLNLRYWHLEVESDDEGDDYCKAHLNVLVDQNEINKHFIYQSNTAQLYKSGTVKAFWKDYWKNKNLFTKVKAFPAQTIHKSQGATYDRSFLMTGCIHKADVELAQELLYVGSTRARTDLFWM